MLHKIKTKINAFHGKQISLSKSHFKVLNVINLELQIIISIFLSQDRKLAQQGLGFGLYILHVL